MIAMQRFNTFATSQNLGFGDLSTIKNSEVYNTVTNKLKEVSSDLEKTAKSAIQGYLPEGVDIDDVNALVKEGIRNTKDTFTALKNMSNFSVSDIENEIASLLPGDRDIQNSFRTLAAVCRDNALSKTPGFKPFEDKIGCGTPGKGKCQSGQVSGFFSKLTNGAIETVKSSIQQMLRALISLGNLGYSGNLCKIFTALTDKLSPNVIQRGAASLLATFGGSGNLPAVFDIASSLAPNINPSLEIPSLVGRISENFAIPTNISVTGYKDLYDGFLTALDSIGPGWSVGTATMSSIASMGSSNGGLMSVASEYIKGSTTFSLDSAPDMNNDICSAAAYATPKVVQSFSSDW